MTEPAVELRDEEPERPRSKGPRPLNWLTLWICRLLFRHVRMEAADVERIRALGSRGPVIYIMRQRSWVDCVLVTYLLMREGLPAPNFATDLAAAWVRPLHQTLRRFARALLARWPVARRVRDFEDRERCQRLVAAGRPVIVFMRGRPSGMSLLMRRRRALRQVRLGSDYLREIIHHMWEAEEEVSLVPLAVVRGRGLRPKDGGFPTVLYTVQEVPTEVRRLVSLLWNSRETTARAGAHIRLREFIQQYRREGEERIVRRLARAMQIFLYREERMVHGPPLLPKRQIRQQILDDPEVRQRLPEIARAVGQSEPQMRRRASRYFDEMAANFNGFYFAIIELIFNRVWPRMFQGLEYSGLERVAEKVRQHPVVLVPCHRSHFDYLILSYIFHLNYLSPPHIAAGINLSFWPLGPLFRGAGAYFIRRSFADDELYKLVFRKYLTFLIRQGYTQEFFIEGGRSRTGKILTPKMGMLSAIVDSFLGGVRRDLYLVPVSIQYGRVVEEDAYQHELGGEEKRKESLWGLLQARSLLRQRHGTAYVTFAEPISLNSALGERKEELRHAEEDDPAAEKKRRFVRKLGFRLLREVNEVTVAGATAVSATVLLSNPHPACRHGTFLARTRAVSDFLVDQGVALSTSLERNMKEDFRESLSFLEDGGLIQIRPLEHDMAVHVRPDKRFALDFYKNNTIHFFLLPALLCDGLSRGLAGEALRDDVLWWLDLLRWEFALPERRGLRGALERLRGQLERCGALRPESDELVSDHPLVETLRGALDNFREAYRIAARALAVLPEETGAARKTVLDAIRKRYETGLLLGEVRKPEGGSVVTFGNALSRFEEIGAIETVAGKGRDPLIRRGEEFERLASIAARIERSTMWP